MNGWITKRHWRQGGSLNRTPSNNGSDKGPLRKKIRFIRDDGRTGIFMKERWELECGHEAWCTSGSIRSRCPKCKEVLINQNEK